MWRVEFFKIGKRDFTFIREMRVGPLVHYKPFYVLHRVRVHIKDVGHNFWIYNASIIELI